MKSIYIFSIIVSGGGVERERDMAWGGGRERHACVGIRAKAPDYEDQWTTSVSGSLLFPL